MFLKTLGTKLLLGVLLVSLAFGALELLLLLSVSLKRYSANAMADYVQELRKLGLPAKFLPRGYASPRSGKRLTLMSSSPAYRRDEWAAEYWRLEHDYDAQTKPQQIFQPDTLWRDKPRRSKFVNVSAQGLRNTVNPTPAGRSHTKSLFTYGGSAMFGAGVPDQYTIASLLSERLNSSGGETYYQVTNWGANAFVLEQDFRLFFTELRKGNRPDVAIFYNGANDAYASVFSPGKAGWYLNSAEIEAKLMAQPASFRPLLFQYGARALAAMRTIRRSRPFPDYYLEDYSQKATEFAEYYRETVAIIHSLCEASGVHCYFFIQPCLAWGDKPLEEFERAMVDHPALLAAGSFVEADGIYQTKAMRAAYRMLEDVKLPAEALHNLSHVFDGISEPIYIDQVHVGAAGNAIIAEKIAQVVAKGSAN